MLRAAWKLAPKDGMARIKKLAAWLDQKYPSAAGSLVEGLEECFTINRLDVPPSLCRCLATTNIIESPHAGGTHPDPSRDSLAKRQDGSALDGFGFHILREGGSVLGRLPTIGHILDPG